MRSLIVALMGLALAGSAVVAQSLEGRLKSVQESATLRIAYRTDSRPFAYLDPQGKPEWAAHLVVSEYAPGVEPAPWRFPARNRIVAGLAAVTIVVEARDASGALITADLALEEGREVFAVPGEITSGLSRGTNALLRLGATPLTSTDDVLESLGMTRAVPVRPSGSGDAATVLACLRDTAATADELVRSTGFDAGTVAAALTELELADLVATEREVPCIELTERERQSEAGVGAPVRGHSRRARLGRMEVPPATASYWLEDARPEIASRAARNNSWDGIWTDA